MKYYVEHFSDRIQDGAWYLVDQVPAPEKKAQQLANSYGRNVKLEYSSVKNDFTIFKPNKDKEVESLVTEGEIF